MRNGNPVAQEVKRTGRVCRANCVWRQSDYHNAMGSRGRAKLAISQGLSVWLLEALEGFGDQDFHSHHALQLTICFDGSLALATDRLTLSGDVIAVAPDVRHQITADGLIGIVFVEPESRRGEILSRRLFQGQDIVKLGDGDFIRLINPLRRALDEPLAREQMLEIGAAAIEALAPIESSETTDSRILSIIDYVAVHLDQTVELRGAAESAGVFLSEGRLRHLFVEQTGLAFKTYLLWLRLVRAVQFYSEGQTLTEAAHSAGFADSAHFSRVFKRTFGAPATTLTRL